MSEPDREAEEAAETKMLQERSTLAISAEMIAQAILEVHRRQMQPPVDTTVLSSDLEEFRKILDVVFTEHGIQQVARLVYLTEAWWNDTVDWADRVLSEDTDD